MRAKDSAEDRDAAWGDLQELIHGHFGGRERQDMVRSFIADNAKKLLPIIKKLAE